VKLPSVCFLLLMRFVICFVTGWSWHEGGVGTVESEAWGELLYGWAWSDTESRHSCPCCSSGELLPTESVDKPWRCWAWSMHSSVCWSNLLLVLWGTRKPCVCSLWFGHKVQCLLFTNYNNTRICKASYSRCFGGAILLKSVQQAWLACLFCM